MGEGVGGLLEFCESRDRFFNSPQQQKQIRTKGAVCCVLLFLTVARPILRYTFTVKQVPGQENEGKKSNAHDEQRNVSIFLFPSVGTWYLRTLLLTAALR